MRSIHLVWFILPALAVVLAACSPSPDLVETTTAAPAAGEGVATITAADAGGDPAEVHCDDPFDGRTPAFQTTGWETNFCTHSVPYDEIFSGGPPRDGIPPIDNPRFESVSTADGWIEDLEPVILLDHKGEARAYPLQILTWHEIVNGEIAGDPVVVTFCPLCNTALVFRRPVVDGEILTFGTSGNLRYSDLVMWDRQTESWWQQFNGEAIVGDLTGTRLEPLPAAIISWEDFKENHPDGEVLSIDTGFTRSYGRNPYAGYDNANSFPFAFRGGLDGDLPPMARVVGVMLENGQGGAFNRELIQEEGVLNETVGDTPLVIFWKAGTASALDSGSIPEGRDIGASAVYERTLDHQELTFSSNGDGTFTDQETGSTWDILGSALDGPLAGSQLKAVPYHDTFWFAWAAFVPDSSLTQ
jgi:hypothetical protein